MSEHRVTLEWTRETPGFAYQSYNLGGFYQTARKHSVSFLEKFGYFWCDGRIHPLPQPS